MRWVAFLLLTGCTLSHPAVPETCSLEAGTAIRHEAGEVPAQVNTMAVKFQWRFKGGK